MTLEDALIYAAKNHKGQKDKAGKPYILHPIRIMVRLGLDATDTERIVALFHDLVEDTDVTIDILKNFPLSEEQIDAIDRLTHKEGQLWDDYIDGIMENPISKRVKIADLEDNMDYKRLKNKRNLQDKDFKRIGKYVKTWLKMTGQ